METKKPFHPRNRHQGRYDFEALTKAVPGLARFVAPNPYGDLSIDFADPEAVKILNRALLKQFYGIEHWDIPPGYLCPPVPGRSDYLHHIADLLASSNGDKIPQGRSIRVLDIGSGANCVYPIIGHCEYGWTFVGTEVDEIALKAAKQVVDSNPALRGAIELRQQRELSSLLKGIVAEGEIFDFSICNPPFHSSREEAREGTQRKWKNLGREPIDAKKTAPLLNFGGQDKELWYPGGELAFTRKLVRESVDHAKRFFFFSTLVSRSEHLPGLYEAIEKAGAYDCATIDMAQGQKKSRIVAWTFLEPRAQEEWRTKRWATKP